MSHSNEFWNFGNADRSEDTPKGYFTPLFPHNLGRPLHHPEQDYNAHLISQIIKGFRVIGSGDDGVMTTNDLEMGIKLHEIDPSDADYLHYIACGCKDEEWIWVPAEMGGIAVSPFNITAYATDINPCNNTDAVITAQGTGGTTPYLYSLQTSPNINPANISDWVVFGSFSGWPTSADALNDTANYYVYGKDALNTIDIEGPIDINTIVPLEITLSYTDATQPNGDDGTITVNVTGGVGAYTYTLSQGNNIIEQYGPTNMEEYTFGNPNALIGAGDYNVEVADASTGCTDNEDVTVSQPESLSFNYTKNNAICAGFNHATTNFGTDSFIFENVTGGTLPYEYSITDPATTGYTWVTTNQFEVPNPGGGQNVTIYPAVKDATGYIQETPGGVTFYDPDVYDFEVLGVAASCNGNNQGSITFSNLTGGPDALHWTGDEYWQFSVDDGTNWAPAFPTPFHETAISTSYDYTGLPEGEYLCRIRRVYESSPGVWIAACPSTNKPATVDPAISVEFSLSAADDSVCGILGDGILTIDNILIGGQNASLDYTVTWADANGNNSGSQTGSNPNYTIQGLDAGTYTVTITDNGPGGCDKTEIATIGQTANNLSLTVDATGEILCGGSVNISYSYSGATGGITIYDVTDPTVTLASGQAGSGSGLLTISNIGTYVFEIKDSATQCTYQAQTEITGVIQAVNLISLVNPSCGADGSIEIEVTNATGELYQLVLQPDANGNGGSAGSPQASGSFNGLDGGDYIINITGGDLCNPPLQYTFTLADANPPVLTLNSQTNITCNGDNDGAISVTLSGSPTSSSTYAWTGPNGFTSNAQNPSALLAGTYNLTYTDNDTGCTATLEVTLTEPTGFTEDLSVWSGGCGVLSMTVNFELTGGVGPYTFELFADNGTPGPDSTDISLDTQTNIAPGQAVIYGNEWIINPNDPGNPLPSIWTGPGGNGEEGGLYYIQVTDANGCVEHYNFVGVECFLFLASNSPIDCNGGNASSISITASGGSGSYEFSDDNITWTSAYIGDPSTHTFNGTYQGGSSYTFYARDTSNPGAAQTITHTVIHPDPVSATMLASTDESIAGAVDGAINLENIIGGSGSYASIQLYNATSNAQIGSPISSPVQNTPYIFSSLSADSYYVIVTDDNGCESDKIFATVGVAGSALGFTSYLGSITCFNGTTDVNVVVNGGSGTFRFSNDNGSSWTAFLTQSSYNFTGMGAGQHTIIVEDQQSYTNNVMSSVITLNQPTEVIATINSTSDETIAGQNDGTISIEMSGGTPDYVLKLYGQNGLVGTITGSAGQTTYQWSNLEPGTYSYTAEDSNGCDAATTNITIAGGSPQISIVGQLVGDDIECNGGNTDVTMTVQDGSGDYRYSTFSSLTNSYSGTYEPVTTSTTNTWNVVEGTRYFFVKDNVTGTIASASITILEATAISASVTGQESYPGANDAVTVITVSGGTAPYTVTSGSETQTIATDGGNAQFTTIISAGTYSFNIVDDNECDKDVDYTVGTQYTNIAITNVIDDTLCYGETNGKIEIYPSGGSGNYEFSRNGGSSYSSANYSTYGYGVFLQVAPGSYDVWIRDTSTGEELEWSSNPVVISEAQEIQVISETMTDGTCSTYPNYTMTFSGSNITQVLSNQQVRLKFTSPVIAQVSATVTATGTPNVYQADYTSAQWQQLDNAMPSQYDFTSGTFNLEIESDDCEITHGPISYTTADDIVLTVNPVSQPECPSDGWTYEVSATGGTNTTYNLMTAPSTLITTWDGSSLQITLPQTVSGSTALLAQDIDFANNGCQSVAIVADTRIVSVVEVNGSVNNPNCAASGGSTYSFTITGGLPGGTANNTYKYKVSTDGGSTYPNNAADYTSAVGPVGISDGDIYIKAYRIVNSNSTEGTCDVEEGIGQVTNPVAISGSIDSGSTSGPTACSGGNASNGQIAMNVTGGTGTYEFSYDGGNTWYTLNETLPGSGAYKFTGLSAGVYGIVARDTNDCIAFTDTVTLSAPNSPVVQSHKIEGCWRDADGASVRTEVLVANNGTSNSAGLYTFTDTSADAPTTNTTGVFTYSNSDMTTHVQTPITITETSTQCSYVMNTFNFTAIPSLTSNGVIGNFNNTPSGNPTGTYDTDDFKVWNIGANGNTGNGGPYTVELINSSGNVYGTINNATTGNNYIYDVPSGDYTYKIYDSTGLTGCGRTYNTPMTSTQQVLNEETFYHIHAGGGGIPYADLMTVGATYYTSQDPNYGGTTDFNVIMADAIDNWEGTTNNPVGTLLPNTGTFEFAGPITGNNCGQTWTHITHPDDGIHYYYLAVPDNSSFTENLVTDGVFQFSCNGLTSYANARRAFTYNGENYWLYKLVSGTGDSADEYGFK